DLAHFLEEQDATVIGPVGTVIAALALVEREGKLLDAAVLDINLRGERVYPVADSILLLGIPVVFTTAYDGVPTGTHDGVPRCPKPIDKPAFVRILEDAIA